MGHHSSHGFHTKSLRRGDIIWVNLSQNFSPANSNKGPQEKTRPFIILNTKVDIRLDNGGRCVRSDTLIGVDGTSKPYLVDGRPHITFEMGHSDTTSYALIDSLRTIDAHHHRFSHINHLTDQELNALMKGIDEVLRPEQRFYLKSLCDRLLMPGEIWACETPTFRGTAMVLLRRGRFFTDGFAEPPTDTDFASRRTRFSPYLVAAFRRSGISTLRGIGWKDVDVMAVPENALVSREGSMTDETVGIFLNNLRGRIGLEPISFQQPVVRSALNRLAFASFLRKLFY